MFKKRYKEWLGEREWEWERASERKREGERERGRGREREREGEGQCERGSDMMRKCNAWRDVVTHQSRFVWKQTSFSESPITQPIPIQIPILILILIRIQAFLMISMPSPIQILIKLIQAPNLKWSLSILKPFNAPTLFCFECFFSTKTSSWAFNPILHLKQEKKFKAMKKCFFWETEFRSRFEICGFRFELEFEMLFCRNRSLLTFQKILLLLTLKGLLWLSFPSNDLAYVGILSVLLFMAIGD